MSGDATYYQTARVNVTFVIVIGQLVSFIWRNIRDYCRIVNATRHASGAKLLGQVALLRDRLDMTCNIESLEPTLMIVPVFMYARRRIYAGREDILYLVRVLAIDATEQPVRRTTCLGDDEIDRTSAGLGDGAPYAELVFVETCNAIGQGCRARAENEDGVLANAMGAMTATRLLGL